LLNSYLGLVRHDEATEPVDLEEVCRRVVQLLAFTARKAHVEIKLTVTEDVPSIRGAADRLQQAVLNLALNAIQAMPTGGVVTIDLGREEGRARVTVSDTGPGIPKDLEGRLFEKPMTTKAGGSGLGLPLVRMIVEAHGGTVRGGASKSGRGASFTILLPQAARA
jgi:signal transduction histidine kinase